MEALDQRVNTLLVEVETAQAIAARRPQFEADVQELSIQLDELKQILPDEKETAEIVRRVEQLAVESDLSIRSFTPQATVAYEFYEDWPIRMSLEGSYNNLGLFSKGWPTSSALSTSIILKSKPSPIRIQTEPSQQLVRPLRLFFWNKEPRARIMHKFFTVAPETIRPDCVALARAPRRTVQYACGARPASGCPRAPGQDGIFDASLQKPIHNPGSLESDNKNLQ